MAAPFSFDHCIEFLPADSDALLRSIPAAPGVFALRGETGEPYLTRTADLRRRLRRLLAPPEALDDQGRPVLSKRLNLRDKVRYIDYTRTGSDFESALVLYRASRAAFGPEEARRRLRLHPPYLLRVTMSQEHPRVYSTNRLSRRSLAESFGPFPSRAAADRYADAVLDLFQLRRCHEDLEPHPDHPGCVYGEMKKCMQPCKEGNAQACTPGQYAQEAERVFAFFRTRGQSLLEEAAEQRDAASSALDFEAAASLHKQWEKVRAASLLADELIRPIAELRAILLQEAAPSELREQELPTPDKAEHSTQDAAVFLFQNGCLAGPARLSTLGVRAVREQTAVGSSLFAQPLMLAPIPLDDLTTNRPHDHVLLNKEQRDDNKSVLLSEERSDDNKSVLLSEERSDESKDRAPANPAPAAQPFSTLNATAASALSPEDRTRRLLDGLQQQASTTTPTIDEYCDALALLRRWYYRPEKQRAGEVFLPNPDGSWPIRRILNGAARVVLGPPAPVTAVDRDAAKALKTKIIHAGREGVEREVPVLPRRSRTRKSILPSDVTE